MKKRLLLTLTVAVCMLCCAFGLAACGDKDYDFALNDDGTYRITHYYSEVTDTEIVVPSTYNGKAVTKIASNVFQDCDFIEKITLPENLTEIGERTFSRCTSLKSVVLPDGVHTIGEYAFSECTALESVVVPTATKVIGKAAFYDNGSTVAVYYKGTANDWKGVAVGLANSLQEYIYSEMQPMDDLHNYWHYSSDEVTPVRW